jgi:hypothetical protein
MASCVCHRRIYIRVARRGTLAVASRCVARRASAKRRQQPRTSDFMTARYMLLAIGRLTWPHDISAIGNGWIDVDLAHRTESRHMCARPTSAEYVQLMNTATTNEALASAECDVRIVL